MPTRKKVNISHADKIKIVRNLLDSIEDTNIIADEQLGLYATSKDGVTFTVQSDTTINQDFKGKQFLFYNEGQLKKIINYHISQAMTIGKDTNTIMLNPVKEVNPEVMEDNEIVTKEEVTKNNIKNPRYVNMKAGSST